jgi:hypothetical protein
MRALMTEPTPSRLFFLPFNLTANQLPSRFQSFR